MRKKNSILVFILLFFSLILSQTIRAQENKLDIIETKKFELEQEIIAFETKQKEFQELSDFFTSKLLAKKELQNNLLPEEPYNEDELIFFALSQNTSIHIAQQTIKSSQADLESAKALRWPKLSTEISATLIGNPVGPVSIGAGVLGEYSGEQIPSQDILIYKGMENTMYNFSLTFEQPIYTWGKINLGIALAKNALSLSYKQEEKTRNETILQIRALFLSISYVNEIVAILKTQKQLGERLLSFANENLEAGFLKESDVLSIKIRLKEIDIALASTNEQLGSLLSDLSLYSGIPNLETSELDCKPQKILLLPWSKEEAEEKSKKGNDDLEIAFLATEIRKQEASLAKKMASGIPDIGLQIDLSYGGSRFPFIETDWFGQDDWQASISLGLKGVFIGNKGLKTDYIKALSEADKTEKQYLEGREKIAAYIRELYLGLSLLQTKIEYYQLKQDVNKRELDEKKEQMEIGIISEAEFLEPMILALGDLVNAYALLIEYQTKVLTVEMLLGKEAWK